MSSPRIAVLDVDGISSRREELAVKQDRDDEDGRQHEDEGAEEPAEIGKAEEDAAQARIEVAGGDLVHRCGALGRVFGGSRIALGLAAHRDRTDEDRAVVEEAVGPAELEEGIGENRDQPEELGFDQRTVEAAVEGQFGRDLGDQLRRAEQRETPADREDAGRGEEGRSLLQSGHDGGVDHPQIAPEQHTHPASALEVHRGGEPLAGPAALLGQPVVEKPADDEDQERTGIARVEGGHSRLVPLARRSGSLPRKSPGMRQCRRLTGGVMRSEKPVRCRFT